MNKLDSLQSSLTVPSVQPPKNIKKYFKLHFPDIAQNPKKFFNKTFEELKKVYHLHTPEDLKEINKRLESINALDEKIKALKESNAPPADIESLEKEKASEREKIIDYIKARVSSIDADNVSTRVLCTGKEIAEVTSFDRLPDELIQLIILFSDHPWVFFFICKRLARLAKDPRIADFFLNQLSARLRISKEDLVSIAKKLSSSEDSSQHLNFLRKIQINYAKQNQIAPTNRLGWMELEGTIEEHLNSLNAEQFFNMLIENIKENDPFAIFLILALGQIDIYDIRIILKELITCGTKEIALEIAKKLLDLFPEEESSNKSTRNDSLYYLTRIFCTHNDFDQAIYLANAITNEKYKFNTLIEIVMALAQKNPFDEAIFNQIIGKVNTLTDERYKSQTLAEITVALAKNNQFDRAIDIASAITNKGYQSDALGKIAAILIQNSLDQVIKKAYSMADKKYKHGTFTTESLAFNAICSCLIDDLINKCKEIINKTKDTHLKDEKFCEISKILIEKDQFDKAIEVSKNINNNMFIYKIAKKMLNKNQFNKTIKILKNISNHEIHELYSISKKLLNKNEFDKAIELPNKNYRLKNKIICKSLAILFKKNNTDKAIEILNKITDESFNEKKLINIEKITNVLKNTLKYLIDNNKIDEALKIADNIKNEKIKTRANKNISDFLNLKKPI